MKKYIIIVLSIINLSLLSIIVVPIIGRVLFLTGISDNRNNDDYWCVAGWGNSLRHLVDTCDIAFIGDSITMGSDFESYFPNKTIVNLGYPGDDIIGISNRTSHLSNIHPKKVFVMGGINASQFISLNAFKRRYDNLLNNLRKNAPNSEIFIQSILPVSNGKKGCPSNKKIIKLNNIIKDLCDDYRFTFIDLHSLYCSDNEMPKELTKDGLHLQPQSYDRWADAIKNYVE